MKIINLICALGFLVNPISACHASLINLHEKWHQSTGTPLMEGSLIMIVGGWDANHVPYSDAQIVDFSWQTIACPNLPEYPIAMSSATGAIVSGRPLICGGYSGSYTYHSECYQHSKTTNTWTSLTPMTTKRSASASVSLNGKLWVVGGWDGILSNRLSSSEFVSSDGQPSQPGPELPSPRFGHCAVKLSTGQVMLLGGDPESKSAVKFDPDTGTFNTSLPSLKFDRVYFGCAVFKSAMHDNREVVLAAGGHGEATAEVLDHTQPNAKWTEIPGLPTDHVNKKKFYGAAAVTSESGQGAIVQHMEYFYELNCNTSGCSWKILPQQLSPGVRHSVMMTLPPNYNC